MDTTRQGSVTRWIGDLKGGDPAAARELWRRYFETLVRFARARLRSTARAAEDEEDVALSAFDSFCAAAAGGRFPRLEDREDLWRLLVTITARKAADLAQRERAQKRGGGRVVDERALAGAVPGAEFLDAIACPAPTPEFAAILAEECRLRLDGLTDETQRRIALLKMEGFSDQEVADRLGCGLRSVVRKLNLIRKSWRAEPEPSP
jgi:DNA-directed RNA polymerase specialized sigma24 family protein